ncbi:hypothetical protein PR003_g25613 [Phytophthora rubi]|uniref:C2H2-type domain-containing protein n=1 Tax=Phytophthora rubi TaxID=129364 RepID=A0A6A4CDQ8_9STRA|nr:hypothetical protein PR001_g24334 [Phytophthora rubi]KAE9289217.1 hypothetical protein PR003_g25613 [Phytophthora rubi]
MSSDTRSGPLLPNGYLPVGLVLPPRVVPELLKEAIKRTYVGVFNKVGGSDDPFRRQSRVDESSMSSSLLELWKALQVVVAMLHPGWVPTTFSFMNLKRGGAEQEAHQDFSTADMALTEATRPGGAFPPAGDLIHNGIAYRVSNYRIHCYLNYEGVKWTPDIVMNVLPEYGTCQFCGAKWEKGPPIQKHRFYCEKNPKGKVNKLKRKLEGRNNGPYRCELCPSASYPAVSSLRVHKKRHHAA